MLYGIEDLHLVVDPEFGNRSYAQIIFNAMHKAWGEGVESSTLMGRIDSWWLANT